MSKYNGFPDNDRAELSLVEAIRRGSLEEVKDLIARGVDVNWECDLRDNFLRVAIYGGHIEIVRVLLVAGAYVDGSESVYGALQCASRHGQEEILLELIRQGANINVKDKSGYSPLHIAAKLGREGIAKILLNSGASLEQLSGSMGDGLLENRTAVEWAMFHGNERVVRVIEVEVERLKLDGTVGVEEKRKKRISL